MPSTSDYTGANGHLMTQTLAHEQRLWIADGFPESPHRDHVAGAVLLIETLCRVSISLEWACSSVGALWT